MADMMRDYGKATFLRELLKFCRFGLVATGLGLLSCLLRMAAGIDGTRTVDLIGIAMCAVLFMIFLVGRIALLQHFEVTSTSTLPNHRSAGTWKVTILREATVYSCMLAGYFWYATIERIDLPELGGPLRPAIAFSMVFLSAVVVLFRIR